MSDAREELAQAAWEDRNPVCIPEDDQRCGTCARWRGEDAVLLPGRAPARRAAPCEAAGEPEAALLTGNLNGQGLLFTDSRAWCAAWRAGADFIEFLRMQGTG